MYKYKVPNRDNLRFISIAKYKAMKDGDVLQYELIDKRITSKPSMKAIALSSSTIRQIEKNKLNLSGSEDDAEVDSVSLDDQQKEILKDMKIE